MTNVTARAMSAFDPRRTSLGVIRRGACMGPSLDGAQEGCVSSLKNASTLECPLLAETGLELMTTSDPKRTLAESS